MDGVCDDGRHKRVSTYGWMTKVVHSMCFFCGEKLLKTKQGNSLHRRTEMKRQQLTAILMSMVLAVSVCMPTTGIIAQAAEADDDQTIQSSTEETIGEADDVSVPEDDGEGQLTGMPDEEASEEQDPEAEASETKDQEAEASEAQDPEAEVSETEDQEAEVSVAQDPESEDPEINSPGEDSAAVDVSGPEAVEMDDSSLIMEEPEEETVATPAMRGVSSIPNDLDSADPLTQGVSVQGYLDRNEMEEEYYAAYYMFTAEEDGWYTFSSTGSPYTWFYLYDADRQCIYQDFDYNSVCSYDLECTAGTTVYLKITCDSWDSVSYSVLVEPSRNFAAERVGEEYVTAVYGSSVTVSVNARSAAILSYQWDRFYEEEDQYLPVEGAEDSSYTIESVEDDYYDLICHVSDSDGCGADIRFVVQRDSSNNLLVYPEGADWEAGETSVSYEVSPGDRVVLKTVAEAVDTSAVVYEWYIPDRNGNWNPIEGASGDTYVIESAQRTAWYECRVHDQYGNKGTATFGCIIPNHITVTGEGTDENGWMYVPYNESALLKVNVTADDDTNLTYIWSRYNEGTSQFDVLEGESSPEYMTEPMQGRALYSCLVEDPYGNSDWANFSLCIDNHFKAYPKGYDENETYANVTVDYGDELTLEVLVEADDSDGMVYEWTDPLYGIVEGNNTAICTIGNVESEGLYECRVTDRYGNVKHISFCVDVDSHFSAWPAGDEDHDGRVDLYVEEGSQQVLELETSVPEGVSLSYVWIWNDPDMGDDEVGYSGTYTVPHAYDGMFFQCNITDQFGNVQRAYFYIHAGSVTQKSIADAEVSLAQTEFVYDGTEHTPPVTVVYNGETLTEGEDYTVSYTDIVNAGTGVVVVTGTGDYKGSQEAYFTIQKAAQQISISPKGRVLAVGESAELTVTGGHTGYYIESSDNDIVTEDPGLDGTCIRGVSEGSARITVNEFGDENYEPASAWIIVAVAEQITEIQPGDTLSGNVQEGQSAWFRFVAPEKGVYVFYASPTWGIILGGYDENNQYRFQGEDTGENDTYRAEYLFDAGEEIFIKLSECNMSGVSYELRAEKGSSDFYARSDEGRTGETVKYVKAGTAVPLSVVACSESELHYQWSVLDDETGEYAAVEGAVSDTYTTEPVTGNRHYKCAVSDNAGHSADIVFFIRIDNSLTAYPKGMSLGNNYEEIYCRSGQSAEIEVVARADDMSQITYLWHYLPEGEEDDINGWIEIPEVTGNSYTIDSLETTQRYYCTVSDQYGNKEDVYFTLMVESSNQDPAIYPEGAEEGSDTAYLNVRPGSRKKLRVIIASDIPTESLMFEWYDGDDNGIGGAYGTALTTEPVFGTSNYYCQVLDDYGNLTARANFVVSVENEINVRADSYDPEPGPGTSQALRVIAETQDTEEYRFDWYEFRGGVYHEMTSEHSDFIEISSDTCASRYGCLVSDEDGNLGSAEFILSVPEHDPTDNHLRVYPEGAEYEEDTFADLYVLPGEDAYLSVNVSADDMSDMSYVWSHSGDEGLEIVQEGPDLSSCTVESCRKREIYYCKVSDRYGNSCTVRFYIYINNQLMLHPQGEEDDHVYLKVPYNTEAELFVNVDALDGTELNYKWDHLVSGEYECIDGADSTTLTTDPVRGIEKYRFSVNDQYDNYEYAYFELSVDNHLTAYPEGEDPGTSFRSVDVSPGEGIVLKVHVNADDKEGITFDWTDPDGETMEDADTDTLTIDSADRSGSYYCRITDKYGNDAYVTFYLHVDSHLKAYPEGEAGFEGFYDVDAAPGSTVTLRTAATADEGAVLTYEWTGPDGWTIEGADTGVYTTDPIRSYSVYFCTVSDQYGNSAYAHFAVRVQNHLEAHPAGEEAGTHEKTINVLPGEPVTMEVSVAADDPEGITYEWYDENGDSVPNGSGNTYTISSAEQSTEYHCIVSDAYENNAFADFYIIVGNRLDAYPEGMTGSRRKDVHITPGESAVLKVTVASDDPDGLICQWFDEDGNDVEGAVTDTFATGPAVRNTRYRFSVQDAYGNSCGVWFYIYVENHLSVAPADVVDVDNHCNIYVYPGKPAVLRAAVTADDASDLTYAWYTGGEAVENALTDTLTIPSVTHNGHYEFRVSDQYGNTDSAYFNLFVENSLQAHPHGEPDSDTCRVYVPIGESIELKVDADAMDTENLTYEWHYSRPADGDHDVLLEEENTDTVQSVPITGETTYGCQVRDPYGNSVYIVFFLHVETNLNVRPDGAEGNTDTVDLYLNSGESAVLHVIASADEAACPLSYVWYKPTGEFVEGMDIFTTGPVTEDCAYSCMVKDQYGGFRSAYFNLHVSGQPTREIWHAEVTLSKDEYVYDGTPRTPTVTVMYDGETLEEGTDYTVAGYTNNTNAGEAEVCIQGIGNYTSSARKSFTIRRAPQSLSAGSVVVREGSTASLNVTGSHCPISFESSDPAIAQVDADGTITGLQAGTAQITVTAQGNNNYDPASKSVAVTVEIQHRVTFTAGKGCSLAVYVLDSEDAGVGADGIPIASGDYVTAGATIRVESAVKAGYQWTNEGRPEGSYTVDRDLTITAQAEPITYRLTLSAEHGSAASDAENMDEIPYHSSVTVTAGAADEGYEFTGWYQTNGKRLTEETSYTALMISDLTLEARYQQKTGIVTFMSNNNVQKTLPNVSSIAQQDYPEDPAPLYGFAFSGWDKTPEDINSMLRNGENVVVNAVFAPVQISFEVRIYNGESEIPTVRQFTESTVVTVTAKDVADKVFACWEQDGQILTYAKTASIRAVSNCELRAVYTVEEVEAQGTAVIRSAAYNTDTEKLSFVAYLTVPEGAVIDAAGLVSAHVDPPAEEPEESGSGSKSGSGSGESKGTTRSSAKKSAGNSLLKGTGDSGGYDPEQKLSIENAEYVKSSAKAVGKSAPVNYTWNKSNVKPGDIWIARPYVIYRINDEIATVYGDCLTARAGEDYDISEKGTATIKSTTYNTSTKKATFVAYLAVPEGGVIVKAGLVAASADNFDPSTQVLTALNADYAKSSTLAEGKSAPVSYTWNKSKVNSGDIWYARAWLVYTDTVGTEHTVYGSLTKLTAE